MGLDWNIPFLVSSLASSTGGFVAAALGATTAVLLFLTLVVLTLFRKFFTLDQFVEFVAAALSACLWLVALLLLGFGDEFGFLLFLLWVVL